MPKTLALPLLVSLVLLALVAGACAVPSVDSASEPSASEPPASESGGKTEPVAGELAVETISLLGEPLRRPSLAPEFAAEQEALLAKARSELEANPNDPMALLWVGRRLGYLGRYRQAIEVYTRGIQQHLDEPRLFRHRGHRYITVREFERAEADLRRATELLAGREPEVEPDGLPNERNQPTGTTHSSAWYHLGLAHYLQSEFDEALAAYRECMRYSNNPDMRVATSYWLYRTLQQLGRGEEAAAVLEPISAEMDLIENHDYLGLLLLARGERSAEDLLSGEEGLSAATLGYGIGSWYREQGERERAFEIYRKVLAGDAWAAFGYIAAEAEVAHAGS